MASKKACGPRISSVIFNLRNIILFENGYISIAMFGSFGNRVGGFIKGIEKFGEAKTKQDQDLRLAEAKAALRNSASKDPEKLISIDLDTQNVTKKTGIGRGIAAVATNGISLAAASNRGDIYLTIVTDKNTYSLHQSQPRESEIKELKKFVALAESQL